MYIFLEWIFSALINNYASQVMCWTCLLRRDHNCSTRYLSTYGDHLTHIEITISISKLLYEWNIEMIIITIYLPAAMRVEQVGRKGDGSSAGRIPRLPPARLEAGSSHKLQPKHREGAPVKIRSFDIQVLALKSRHQNPTLSGHSAVTNTERALDGLQRDYRLLPEYDDCQAKSKSKTTYCEITKCLKESPGILSGKTNKAAEKAQ